MTQRNGALVEETNASAQAMADQARQLAELVGHFRIDGSDATRDEAEAAADLPAEEAEDTDERTAEAADRSEEHTSELQSLMRNSYAVFCLKKKKKTYTM